MTDEERKPGDPQWSEPIPICSGCYEKFDSIDELEETEDGRGWICSDCKGQE